MASKLKYDQDTISSHLKNLGFIFASSEIYNGLANSWDYGPLGVLLKNNLKQLWWNEFITTQKNMYGLDSMILLNPLVWQASGHLQNFADPLIDCRNCKSRFRADKLIESVDSNIVISETSSNLEIQTWLKKLNIVCPNCNKFDWTDVRYFNLMFKTHQGVVENNTTEIYLRPETAQGIFINFKNIQRTTRAKIPFGVGQIGKAFRNEITPGNFIFRTREFEQMEIEFFLEEKEYELWFDFFMKKIASFLENDCNINKELI
ncbi:MAG: glycine--tRNA ligase, partial [Ureaplasma sp.]|nr:glycine--tRNA ligase [Ureaplasma sp.]